MGIKTNNIEITGGLTLNGVNIIDMVHPIGSIYMSENNTHPQTLFGGTWVQIKDKFILAAGDTYHNGNTGGSADAVVVSHSHSVIEYAQGSVWADRNEVNDRTLVHQQTGNLGSNSPHSILWHAGTYNIIELAGEKTNNVGENGIGKNMPPYLVVYMWKRIA